MAILLLLTDCLSRAQRGESILSQLCWWKICLSRSAQWDKVIEIEPAIHACYATQGTCLSRLVALPWISKDISLHHCATDVRLYVWPYRIFLVTQTTNRVLGSSFLAKRSVCSLVNMSCHWSHTKKKLPWLGFEPQTWKTGKAPYDCLLLHTVIQWMFIRQFALFPSR